MIIITWFYNKEVPDFFPPSKKLFSNIFKQKKIDLKFDNEINLPYKIHVYDIKNNNISIKAFNEDTKTNYNSEMTLNILSKITKRAMNTNAWNTDKSVGISLKAKLIFDSNVKKNSNGKNKETMSKTDSMSREITLKEVASKAFQS